MPNFSANLSMLFAEYALPDRFKAARQSGFNAVEIQFPYSLSAATLKTLLDDNQLKMVLFNVDADDLLQGGEGLACVPRKRGQFLQSLEHALRYAEVLKPVAVNVLPGRCFDSRQQDAYRQTLLANLQLAAQSLAPLGVKCVFEAINNQDMPGFIVNTGEQMVVILDVLNQANLSMQYDIYHAKMMGADVGPFITAHAQRIGHIQFADCPGRAQPGTGEIGFQKLFSVIDDAGYDGWVGAEYKPLGATAASLQWLD